MRQAGSLSNASDLRRDVTENDSTAAANADESPLVTVAIPTYRRPDLLRRAIASALAQTYRNMDIVVSDSDASEEIASLVASYGDSRLRYRHNGRQTPALENALELYREARGDLIATLHDDDEWEPDYLAAMVKPLVEDPTVVLTFADHWLIDAESRVLAGATERFTRARGRSGLPAGRHQPFTRLALVDRAMNISVATVFRNGLIDWDEVPQEVVPPYDVWMLYLASRDGAAAYYIPDRLMRYRWHEESTSENTRLEAPFVWIYDHVLLDERLADIRADLVRTSAPLRASLGISLLAEGDAVQARRHLWRGLRGGAWLKAGAGLAISLLPPSRRADAIERLRSETRRRRLQTA
jgi:glycosyltransferase involved in cell wall biosynthesis